MLSFMLNIMLYVIPLKTISARSATEERKMQTMSDEEFIEFIITERIQQYYTSWKTNTENKQIELDKIEKEYEAVISTLSEQDKQAIKTYFDSLLDDSVSKTDFFYRAGVKDGYNLYDRITGNSI